MRSASCLILFDRLTIINIGSISDQDIEVNHLRTCPFWLTGLSELTSVPLHAKVPQRTQRLPRTFNQACLSVYARDMSLQSPGAAVALFSLLVTRYSERARAARIMAIIMLPAGAAASLQAGPAALSFAAFASESALRCCQMCRLLCPTCSVA